MTTEIFKELLVTENDLLQQAVSKAKDVIGIEEKSGRVILRVPRAALGQRQIVLLFLMGQYFAKQMGKANSASLSLEELSDRTGIDPNTLSGRLSEHVKADWVRKLGRGQFEINQYLLNSILDEIVLSRRRSELIQTTPSSLDEETNQSVATTSREPLPTIGKDKSLTEAILHLLRTDWGKTPRDWGEVHRALKHNALHYSKGSITGTLTLLTQSGRVRRIKDGRSYKYLLP